MNLHRFMVKDDFYEQNFWNNRQILKELLEKNLNQNRHIPSAKQVATISQFPYCNEHSVRVVREFLINNMESLYLNYH